MFIVKGIYKMKLCDNCENKQKNGYKTIFLKFFQRQSTKFLIPLPVSRKPVHKPGGGEVLRVTDSWTDMIWQFHVHTPLWPYLVDLVEKPLLVTPARYINILNFLSGPYFNFISWNWLFRRFVYGILDKSVYDTLPAEVYICWS